MQSIICTTSATQTQQMEREWFGNPVIPAVEYSFSTDGKNLIYRAAQAAPVQPHPEGKCGEFREELWKYDTAEFFIAAESGSPYVEVNISPSGAWWACAFSAPRVPLTPAVDWAGVQAGGTVSQQGWQCNISIPLSLLAALGITPENCRLAATAILNSPDYIYLTTAEDTSGEPDFHRPQAWPKAVLS
ncbi:MAG: hypothetical protein IJB00_05910 [Akkermansia sp.]|nr:hypothetical protein [Akkermansia sp.]